MSTKWHLKLNGRRKRIEITYRDYTRYSVRTLSPITMARRREIKENGKNM